jgi:hypothetical protein
MSSWLAIPTDGLVSAPAKLADQFHAELAAASDYRRFSRHRKYEDSIRRNEAAGFSTEWCRMTINQ